jgi:hypothetical protein
VSGSVTRFVHHANMLEMLSFLSVYQVMKPQIVASASSEYVPATQDVHAVLPYCEYLQAGHTAHTARLLAAMDADEVPAGHFRNVALLVPPFQSRSLPGTACSSDFPLQNMFLLDTQCTWMAM